MNWPNKFQGFHPRWRETKSEQTSPSLVCVCVWVSREPVLGVKGPDPSQDKADPDDHVAVPALFLNPEAPLWVSLENTEVPRVAYTFFTP